MHSAHQSCCLFPVQRLLWAIFPHPLHFLHPAAHEDVPSLFWRCDGCVKVMETPEYRTAFRALCEAFHNVSETQTKDIEEVKAELAETNEKIGQLMSKLPDPKVEPTWPSGKRRRSSSSSVKPEVPKASVDRKVMKSAVPILPTTDGPDDMVWIWLSSFPPTVTEDDIRVMVRECLSFDDDEIIDVKMLRRCHMTKLAFNAASSRCRRYNRYRYNVYILLIASRFLKKKNASVSPRPKTIAISVPRNGHPGTPALYVTQDLKFKLKNTVPEFAGDGTVRYGCYLLAAASVVGYVFMETTAGQGDR
ncbi:hypothetical protein quinque_013687 [Culex quinquefasciatus]